MKNLARNIWEVSASTIAGGPVAALGILTAANVEMPPLTMLPLSALAVFDGQTKPAAFRPPAPADAGGRAV